jgi:hypothetical protein
MSRGRALRLGGWTVVRQGKVRAAANAVRSPSRRGGLVVAIASLCVVPSALCARDGDGAIQIIAAAVDTGCVVFRTGDSIDRACVGAALGPDGPNLAAVDAESVTLRLDSAAGQRTLQARVRIGATLDPQAIRSKFRESTGPRPGWIESDQLLDSPKRVEQDK